MADTKSSLPLADGRQPVGPTAIGLSLLTAALWGGTPVAISYSVDDLPPVAVSGIRFAMAAMFMLVWCRAEGTSLKLRAGQLKPCLIMSVLLFAQIALFTTGIAKSNSSHAIVLINTYIFWVAGIEHWITGNIRMTASKVMGLVFAAAGGLTIVMMSDLAGRQSMRDVPTVSGNAILLASAFLLGIKITYTKHASMRVEPSKLIFWHDVFGVILFAAWSAGMEDVSFHNLHQPAVLGLLYQGVVVAGFCFVVQARLLQRHSAAKIAVYSIASPLFGILLASLFRGDRLSPWLFVSAALVAAGIGMVGTKDAD